MERRLLQLILTGTVAAALLSPTAEGQGNSQGKGKGKNKGEEARQDDSRGPDRGRVRIVFSARDLEIIRDYYHDRYSNLPPGLAKRNGNLPPGLQKHLERDGTLPPGLQKRVEPFPEELERRLPRLPDIYRRVVLGVDIIILDRRTQRIMDIVRDILRP
jgi:hypothetical protein